MRLCVDVVVTTAPSWGMQLGKIVHAIRTKGEYVRLFEVRVRQLEEIGFSWTTEEPQSSAESKKEKDKTPTTNAKVASPQHDKVEWYTLPHPIRGPGPEEFIEQALEMGLFERE